MLSKWVAEPPIPPLRAKTLTPEKASDFLHSGRYAPDVQKDARGVRAFGLLLCLINLALEYLFKWGHSPHTPCAETLAPGTTLTLRSLSARSSLRLTTVK